MQVLKKNHVVYLNVGIFLTIILYGLVLYIPSLQSKTFYFDDHFSIENNEVIKTIDIPRIFDAFNSRFLVGLSFALNYQWCALHAHGYRLINLLIHCLNAFLVYLLVKSTLYLYSARKPMFFCRLEWPAFFGAMLFLCHPIQTEPVNFITQRFVLMGSFFYLLTLYLYIQYRCRINSELDSREQLRAPASVRHEDRVSVNTTFRGNDSYYFLIASWGAAIAAMFCKEFVVTLPLMIAVYDFYFLDALAEPWWKRCSRILPFFIIVLIVPLLLLRTPPEAIQVANIADYNFIQEEGSPRFGSHIDVTRAHGSIGRKQYFLTELNVVCTYVRLLFLPVNQNFDYDYPISNQADNKTVLCGMFLLCLLGLAAVTYQSNRMVSFSILWFFIALSVESSFIPIGHVIAEYRLYLASVGFVFLVMTLIYMRLMDQKKLNIIAAVILIGFSVLTYQRNKVWKDEFTLWNDSVQKSPHKARPYSKRGIAYYQQGNYTQTMSDFNKAIEINPNYAEVYYNRGIVYQKQGNLTLALSDYNKAIEIDPSSAGAYTNRGGVYDEQGNFPQAISDCTKAIEIDPNDLTAYENRGVAYFKQGDFTQALSDYNKAIEINPNYAEVYYNRGNVYDNQGDFTQALSDYNKAIELNPNFAEVYNKRGSVHKGQGHWLEAISDYTKAIALSPEDIGLYMNRGTCYVQQGNFTQAISDYNKVIEINPNIAEVYNNRGNVYNIQGDLTQALSDYSKAVEINPNYAEVYYNRGNIFDNQGNFTKALSDYNKAIEKNPNIAEVYYTRAVIYYHLKKYHQARADVRKAEELGYTVKPEFIRVLNKYK